MHAVLAKDSHSRSVQTKTRSRTDSLLRGLIFTPSGEKMYPTYSKSSRGGQAYRYYVSRSESRYGAADKAFSRIPAGEIEAPVVAQVKSVLTSPEAITAVVRHLQAQGSPIDEASAVMAMGRLREVWDQLFPVEQHRIVNLMIERIDLVQAEGSGELTGINVRWRKIGWAELVREFKPRTIGAELVEVEA